MEPFGSLPFCRLVIITLAYNTLTACDGSNVTHQNVTSNVTHQNVTSNVTHQNVRSNVTHQNVPSDVEHQDVIQNCSKVEYYQQCVIMTEMASADVVCYDMLTPVGDNSPALPSHVDIRGGRERPVAWVDEMFRHNRRPTLDQIVEQVHSVMIVVVRVLEDLKFVVEYGRDVKDCDFMYTRYHLFGEWMSTARRFTSKHMANHFPGIEHLGTKSNFIREHRILPVIPESYHLPHEKHLFQKVMESDPDRLWLLKNKYHRGITLHPAKQIRLDQRSSFVQEFLTDLHLIDNRRWDFGVFVAITSLDPLRAYVYNDWVIRFCAEDFLPFDATKRGSYVIDDTAARFSEMPSLRRYHLNDIPKRDGLFEFLKTEGHDTDKLLTDVHDAIAQMLKVKVPNMIPYLKTHRGISSNLYEMMRFDFMVGQNMEVHLLEANMSPDMTMDDKLVLKYHLMFYKQLLYSVFHLAGVTGPFKFPITQWNDRELNVEVAKRDIRVYGELCAYQCLNNGTKDCSTLECRLCKRCVDSAEQDKHLMRAFVEHNNRRTWRRIVPQPFTSQSDAIAWAPPEGASDNDQLMAAWYRGKCLQDVTWCM